MPLAICVYYEIISSNKDHYNCSMIVRFPEVECIRAYAPSWIEQGLEVIGAYIMSIVGLSLDGHVTLYMNITFNILPF